ncbi:MAG: hypothetical protein ACXWNK_01595 [Vulcanimicrobiaceae bacterium]
MSVITSSRIATKVHVIEPQALFVPMLDEIFREIGLRVSRVMRDAEFQTLLAEQPEIVFVDADFVEQETVNLIVLLRMLLPKTLVAVYTGTHNARRAQACHASGANAVFSKSAGREEFVAGLRQMLETGEYTDRRFRLVPDG